MARLKTKGPTDRELSILRVLWKLGPSTTRRVYDELKGEAVVGYTTVQKMMQIMVDKGLLERDEAGPNHVYRVAQSQQQTREELARDLLEKAFGGSAVGLVVSALSATTVSKEELEQIEVLLAKLKGEQ